MTPFVAFPASTSRQSLEGALSTLQEKSNVFACLLLGSSATGVSEWSDYDLLVVAEFNEAFSVEFSYIDSRATDLILVSRQEFERLLGEERPSSPQDCDVLSWISKSRIAFSNVSEFIDAPQKATAILDGCSVLEEEKFCRWVEANHILLKVGRYLSSPEETYRDGLEILVTKAIADLPLDYLCSRGFRWLGDKDAMKKLREIDDAFAERVLEALRNRSLSEKCASYNALIASAISPVGPVWNSGETGGGWFRFSGGPKERSVWERFFAD